MPIYPHTMVGRFDGAILRKRLGLLENRGGPDILLIKRFRAVVSLTLSHDLTEVTKLICKDKKIFGMVFHLLH